MLIRGMICKRDVPSTACIHTVYLPAEQLLPGTSSTKDLSVFDSFRSYQSKREPAFGVHVSSTPGI